MNALKQSDISSIQASDSNNHFIAPALKLNNVGNESAPLVDQYDNPTCEGLDGPDPKLMTQSHTEREYGTDSAIHRL